MHTSKKCTRNVFVNSYYVATASITIVCVQTTYTSVLPMQVCIVVLPLAVFLPVKRRSDIAGKFNSV